MKDVIICDMHNMKSDSSQIWCKQAKLPFKL